jgi:hypothetical protein
MDALADWVDNHPQARLIIFDTLTRIRDRGKRSGNSESNSLYEDDYDLIAALKKLGDEKHVCVCAVHHTRKPKEQEEDPFDQISGTLGLGGAADAIVVLKRSVGATDAKLHVTGRDVEEQSLSLAWDKETCLWGMLDGEALTPDQTNVIQALTFAGKPLSPVEVYPLIGKNHEATKKLLYRMASDGLILRDRGKYSPLPAPQGGGHTGVPDVPEDVSPFEDVL